MPKNFLTITNGTEHVSILNSTFLNNSAYRGGAVDIVAAQEVEIADNTFEDNVSTLERGGAVSIRSIARELKVVRNVFEDNHAELLGGALSVSVQEEMAGYWHYNGRVVVKDNVFTRNIVRNGRGGALDMQFVSAYNPIFQNNVYRNNTARYGGAMSLSHVCFPRLNSEVHVSNRAELDGGAVYLDLINAYMECADRAKIMLEIVRPFFDTVMT